MFIETLKAISVIGDLEQLQQPVHCLGGQESRVGGGCGAHRPRFKIYNTLHPAAPTLQCFTWCGGHSQEVNTNRRDSFPQYLTERYLQDKIGGDSTVHNIFCTYFSESNMVEWGIPEKFIQNAVQTL